MAIDGKGLAPYVREARAWKVDVERTIFVLQACRKVIFEGAYTHYLIGSKVDAFFGRRDQKCAKAFALLGFCYKALEMVLTKNEPKEGENDQNFLPLQVQRKVFIAYAVHKVLVEGFFAYKILGKRLNLEGLEYAAIVWKVFAALRKPLASVWLKEDATASAPVERAPTYEPSSFHIPTQVEPQPQANPLPVTTEAASEGVSDADIEALDASVDDPRE